MRCIAGLFVLLSLAASAEAAADDTSNLEKLILERCLCLGSLAEFYWTCIGDKVDLFSLDLEIDDETKKAMLRVVQLHYMSPHKLDVAKLARVLAIVKNYRPQDKRVIELIKEFCSLYSAKGCLEMVSLEKMMLWAYPHDFLKIILDTSSSNDEYLEVTRAIDNAICGYVQDLINAAPYNRSREATYAMRSQTHK